VVHSLGLKANGKIVAWENNDYGQSNLPKPSSGFVAVTAGYTFSLGLKSDGSIKAWGRNDTGAFNLPGPNTNFIVVGSGVYHSLGIRVTNEGRFFQLRLANLGQRRKVR
jgi:alpha-tubulin suppressor-like RCC1 family protein